MAVPLHTDPVERSEAFERAMHRTLTRTEDYARRIHWWVRLFGVLSLASVVLVVLVALYFVTAVASAQG